MVTEYNCDKRNISCQLWIVLLCANIHLLLQQLLLWYLTLNITPTPTLTLNLILILIFTLPWTRNPMSDCRYLQLTVLTSFGTFTTKSWMLSWIWDQHCTFVLILETHLTLIQHIIQTAMVVARGFNNIQFSEMHNTIKNSLYVCEK